jgi:hypothetical protein
MDMTYTSCTICGEEAEEETNPIITISCGHKYHFRCIREWYVMNSYIRDCPYCRKRYDTFENLEGLIRNHPNGKRCNWDECSLIGYTELDNQCIYHAYNSFVLKILEEEKKHYENMLSEMTILNMKCSYMNKNGKKCKKLTKYIKDSNNYCEQHFINTNINNDESYISTNDQCEYSKNLYKNGNIRRCKKKICILSGNMKMCKLHFNLHIREDYYEKNREMIDGKIEQIFAFNEKSIDSFMPNSGEYCHWYHPLTNERCKSREIYFNYDTCNHYCKKHTWEIPHCEY